MDRTKVNRPAVEEIPIHTAMPQVLGRSALGRGLRRPSESEKERIRRRLEELGAIRRQA